MELAASQELAGRRGERNRNKNIEEKTRFVTKGPKYSDFQFLNVDRLNELSSKEQQQQDGEKEQQEGEQKEVIFA